MSIIVELDNISFSYSKKSFQIEEFSLRLESGKSHLKYKR